MLRLKLTGRSVLCRSRALCVSCARARDPVSQSVLGSGAAKVAHNLFREWRISSPMRRVQTYEFHRRIRGVPNGTHQSFSSCAELFRGTPPNSDGGTPPKKMSSLCWPSGLSR